jgi:hypothetical protein
LLGGKESWGTESLECFVLVMVFGAKYSILEIFWKNAAKQRFILFKVTNFLVFHVFVYLESDFSFKLFI